MLNDSIAISQTKPDNASLVLCSQNRFSREGLRHMLTSQDLVITGEAGSLIEAQSMLPLTAATDSVLIYETSGKITELDTLTQIARERPDTALIVLTDCSDPNELNAVVATGVTACLPSSISAEALKICLQLVLLGEQIVPMSGVLRSAPCLPPVIDRPFEELRSPLSTREGQILTCLETGLANKQIARDLQMAEATVKVHVKAILRKINVDNRTQAAVWSLNNRREGAELAI
jgi:two-component system nitrate/nitrite response regulator NarL